MKVKLVETFTTVGIELYYSSSVCTPLTKGRAKRKQNISLQLKEAEQMCLLCQMNLTYHFAFVFTFLCLHQFPSIKDPGAVKQNYTGANIT